MRHEVETNRKTYNTEFDLTLGTIALFKYPATKQNRLFVFCTPIISPQFTNTTANTPKLKHKAASRPSAQRMSDPRI